MYAKKVYSLLKSAKTTTLEKHERLGIIRADFYWYKGNKTPDHSSISSWTWSSDCIGFSSIRYSYLRIYVTDEEIGEDIDVQSTVETPEVHIVGRSSSSVEDQSLFSACRNECISKLDTPLHLSNGVEVTDVLRASTTCTAI